MKIRLLRIYLYMYGGLNLVTAMAVPLFLGDLLLWTPRNVPTDLMVGSLYFAMGIVMLFAAKEPLGHKSLLDFVIIANMLHALVMAVFAQSFWHILLDVTFIGSMGLIPLILYPWGLRNFLKY